MFKLGFLTFVTGLLLVSLQCIHSPNSGVIEEQTNKNVTVASSQGTITVTGREKLQVSIVDTSYMPHTKSGYYVTASITPTGEVVFPNLKTGTYNVLARDTANNEAVIFMAVLVSSASSQIKLSDTLCKNNVLVGSVYKPGTHLVPCNN